MQPHLRTRILQLTQAAAIDRSEIIQPLWNNYGTLSRIYLVGGAHASVIVKHIKIPNQLGHPRGFASSISRRRKIRSYEVETHWYQHLNPDIPEGSPSPRCLDSFSEGGELFLLLEDLATRGFDQALDSTSWTEISVVLRWLAHFHAHFLGSSVEGLWPCGTYWHLETRPEELANIEGTRLHTFASLLDARLRCGGYPTLVHGDAKLANFLFSKDRSQVAAVDFQYVGGGAAMKDLAYFVGSCLSGGECAEREAELLEAYFSEIRVVLPAEVDAEALESEWRSLYPVAWADFERFMLGWSPGHRKLSSYSEASTQRAIDEISNELMSAAREACLAAGRFIQENRDRPLETQSKGFESQAADIVTDIDLAAQAIILDILKPSIKRYDLGVLAEEGEQDESRLDKHAFWTIDPLDGTQYFLEGKRGYATSIALVSQSGQAILGLVYDPVHENLYEVVAGQGVLLNGMPIPPPTRTQGPTRWFADRSLMHHADFAQYKDRFDLHFVGGAVTNGLQLLTEANSIYLKAPKAALGGCAIWDLAAVTLMLSECSGTVQTYDGSKLNLNRPQSPYFNDLGLALASADLDLEALLSEIKTIGSSDSS